jgi:7-carboxy-7-deazaguanine synthase
VALVVNEIFHSIQGESSYAGWPCVFVRLAGCNLRCSYCDTRYAYDQGVELTLDNVIREVVGRGCPLVEITGGEPLIQEEAPELIGRLLDLDYAVLLETNGSRDISPVDARCIKIVDVKCPSSGEGASFDYKNLGRLGERDEIKCVIGTREDYVFAKNIAAAVHEEASPRNVVHFSPVFGTLDAKDLAEWILEDRIRVRLGLQLHKLIWSPDRRGV